MAKAATPLMTRGLPIAVGAASVIGVFALLEALLRLGVVNRYIVPLPSDVLLSLERIIVEENVLARMRETAYEVVMAGLFTILVGVPIGAAL